MSPRKPATNQFPGLRLSAEDRAALKALGRQRVKARVWRRARILELLDKGWTMSATAAAAGTYPREVRRVGRRFLASGLAEALGEDARPKEARLLDARQEAAIVAMVCAPPPAGRSRWTLTLIAEEAAHKRIVAKVGRETIRRMLNRHELKPWREKGNGARAPHGRTAWTSLAGTPCQEPNHPAEPRSFQCEPLRRTRALEVFPLIAPICSFLAESRSASLIRVTSMTSRTGLQEHDSGCRDTKHACPLRCYEAETRACGGRVAYAAGPSEEESRDPSPGLSRTRCRHRGRRGLDRAAAGSPWRFRPTPSARVAGILGLAGSTGRRPAELRASRALHGNARLGDDPGDRISEGPRRLDQGDRTDDARGSLRARGPRAPGGGALQNARVELSLETAEGAVWVRSATVVPELVERDPAPGATAVEWIPMAIDERSARCMVKAMSGKKIVAPSAHPGRRWTLSYRLLTRPG